MAVSDDADRYCQGSSRNPILLRFSRSPGYSSSMMVLLVVISSNYLVQTRTMLRCRFSFRKRKSTNRHFFGFIKLSHSCFTHESWVVKYMFGAFRLFCKDSSLFTYLDI